MRRHRLIAGSLVAATALAAGAAAAPTGEALDGQAARVVDRTFRCTPAAAPAGSPEFRLDSLPRGARDVWNPGQEASPGFVALSTAERDPLSEFVSVRARQWERFEGRISLDGVYASVSRCRATRGTVALTPSGLPGPAVRWAKHARCLVGGQVLVRVRATLESPAVWWRVTGAYAGARANVVAASMAVRSARTRKPVAFVELDRNGKTKLWISAACT